MSRANITPIAVNVEGESFETKQKIMDLMVRTFGLKPLNNGIMDDTDRLTNTDRAGDVLNCIMWGCGALSLAQSKKLEEGENLTAKKFLDKYDNEAKPDTEVKPYVKWDDLVTITINAYEMVKLPPTSGGQPSSGLDNTIYDFVKSIANIDPWYEHWYHDITPDKLWAMASDEEEKRS